MTSVDEPKHCALARLSPRLVDRDMELAIEKVTVLQAVDLQVSIERNKEIK